MKPSLHVLFGSNRRYVLGQTTQFWRRRGRHLSRHPLSKLAPHTDIRTFRPTKSDLACIRPTCMAIFSGIWLLVSMAPSHFKSANFSMLGNQRTVVSKRWAKETKLFWLFPKSFVLLRRLLSGEMYLLEFLLFLDRMRSRKWRETLWRGVRGASEKKNYSFKHCTYNDTRIFAECTQGAELRRAPSDGKRMLF